MAWEQSDAQDILIDPRTTGAGNFPPIVKEEQWIEANEKLMLALGPEAYLRALLGALNRNPVPSWLIPTEEPEADASGVPEAQARVIWLAGYGRALANVAGAPFSFHPVMDGKMERHFQKWFNGEEGY